MIKKQKIVVQGWDLALNHSGYVELTNGELTNFWYITNKAGSAACSKEHGCRLVLPKSNDRQITSVARLAFIKKFITKRVLRSIPEFVGIEDYAIRAEQGAHYMGEVGGLARLICWSKKIPFRLHDPISVKMFVSHDGTCQKDLVEKKVKERWKVDFEKYNQPKMKTSKQDRTTSEDLADAYSIAKLVWYEICLRNGSMVMSDLHQKEIQVFNRATKTYPLNLLSREWIVKK
jgi:Holliday junction resolvasome RuvABC endonuclease subunit